MIVPGLILSTCSLPAFANKIAAVENEDAVQVTLAIINGLIKYTTDNHIVQDTPFDLIQNGVTDSEDNKTSPIEYYDFEDFLDYIIEKLGTDSTIIILAMMILDKFIEKNPDFNISEKNVSK